MPRLSRTRSARPPESSPPESSPPGQPGDAPRSPDFPGGPARPPTSFAARAAAGLLLALAALFALPTVALAQFATPTATCTETSCTIADLLQTLDPDSVPATGLFTVTSGGRSISVGSTAVENRALVVLSGLSSILTGETVTIAYDDPDGEQTSGIIQTLGGSDWPDFSITATNNSTQNGPTLDTSLLGSFCEANNCRLNFDRRLDNVNKAGADAFTVTADGNSISFRTLDYSAPSFTNVFLFNLSYPILKGQTVVVSYSDPTTGDDANALQDLAGIDAQSFSETVRNASDLTAPKATFAITSSPLIESTYRLHESIEVTATFDEAVTLSGRVLATLWIGGGSRGAVYDRGSGTRRLVFRYVVRGGDVDDVSGCVKARISGEQGIRHPAICGAGDDSERWVSI